MNSPFREHAFKLPEPYRPRGPKLVVAVVMTVAGLSVLVAAPVLCLLAMLGGA